MLPAVEAVSIAAAMSSSGTLPAPSLGGRRVATYTIMHDSAVQANQYIMTRHTA
jgi:hypothetical protein